MSDSSALRDALKQSPNNLSLLLLHGRACLEEMMLEEARKTFGRALELAPDHADAQLGMARVLFL
jgi:cytochrome c-type biogenesis protein CcmH/NrfG